MPVGEEANLFTEEKDHWTQTQRNLIAVAVWIYEKKLLEHEEIEKQTTDKEEIINAYKKYLIIISTFIPYIANECWEKITGKQDINLQEWPRIDDSLLCKENYDIVIQVNGKKRAIINATNNESEENILSKSLAIKNIQVILDKKIIEKKIFIKNKLLNIVTNDE